MKFDAFRVVTIAYLLLLGSVSYAADKNTPVAVESDANTFLAKPNDANTAVTKTIDVPKVSVTKLNNGVKDRSIDRSPPQSPNKSCEPSLDTKKRIEELEALVADQQKLIGIYQNQNKESLK